MHIGKPRGTEIQRFIEADKLIALSLGEQSNGSTFKGNDFLGRVGDDLTYVRTATTALLVSRGSPALAYISSTIMDTENYYKTV